MAQAAEPGQAVRMVKRFGLIAALLATGSACSGAPDIGEASPRPELAGQYLFVTNKHDDSLSKIDLGTGEEIKRVDTCSNPHELALSPDGEHIAITCFGETGIEILRNSDLAKVNRIELGDNARPHGIAWHASGALLATAEGRKSLFLVENPLSKATQVQEVKTGEDGTHMLAVSADLTRAWTANMGSGTVSLLDLRALRAVKSVTSGEESEGIALSPDESALWVSARGAGMVTEFDPLTLEARREIPAGSVPLRVKVHPDGREAVTSNMGQGTLSVIDIASGRVSRTIEVSGQGRARQVTVEFSRDGSRLYAAEAGWDTVAEVDFASGKVVRRLKVGPGGDGLAVKE